VARARRRVATPGAATSGAARQLRSPSFVLIALGDLSRIVFSCIGWSVAWANSHKGNWAPATVSALFRTKGDDGGRHRRRRQVNRAFRHVPLAAPLPGSGDPIGGTFLGRQRWDTSLFGRVATGLCYTLSPPPPLRPPHYSHHRYHHPSAHPPHLRPCRRRKRPPPSHTPRPRPGSIAVFPILADVIEVKKGSGSTAHWPIHFIRLNGLLRYSFAQLITLLDIDGIGQNWEDSNTLLP